MHRRVLDKTNGQDFSKDAKVDLEAFTKGDFAAFSKPDGLCLKHLIFINLCGRVGSCMCL